MKKISPQSISKQWMMVFQVMRMLLMITMKLNQTLVLSICDGIKISNWILFRDTELEEDIMNGWKKVKNDEVPDRGPFTDFDGLNFSTESHNLEDFFNQLFDEYMYTRMAQETNSYAHDKIRKVLQDRDPFEQMDYHNHRQHARLGT